MNPISERLFKLTDVTSFCEKEGKKNIFYETEKTAGAVWCLRPGQSIFTHSHTTSDDLWIVVRGTGTFYPRPNEEVEITSGDMIISYPGDQHGMTNTGDEDFVVIGVAGPQPMDLILPE
ncbi:Cupin domain-containing protein [Pilibacter termitis]|uniref:Cupin domain-containing protein n=2 Tax=Pilibacter termitis TaxID=263852 RepID=A0A1T4LCR5_9ENTE|nr:Cupin domain-containing protein [Pilibacter termitis]